MTHIRYTADELIDYDRLVARGRSLYDDLRLEGMDHQSAMTKAYNTHGLKLGQPDPDDDDALHH